jgi:predicted CXXCH cytochrome family protein
MRNKSLSVDCSSCHTPHGSEHKVLAHFDPRAELCVQCHEEYKR